MQKQIVIEEQGLRDGLQTIALKIPVAKRLEWIQQLINAGIQRIQVASFVHPKLVPQMADAEKLIKALPSKEQVIFSALVLNVKGMERAMAVGVKSLAISLSASNTHSLKNANKSIADAKLEFQEMTKLALTNSIIIRGGVQCAFGCRYEGKIEEQVVYDLVKHHLDSGVHEIALADSTGMGNPIQVKRVIEKVTQLCGDIPVSLHLHNTENKGYANMIAALEVGVRQFDTAFGGLGGCPFIKGATGNIATEDTVHVLEEMGYTTGVDIQKVAAVSKEMEMMLGEKLPGLMYNLGEGTA
jgi:hydroxymethylglutaryl-CoA lyase